MRKHLISNKKGIELSINFIVMLILAIVGFVMGLLFIPQLFKASNDIYQELDSQSKDILMNQESGLTSFSTLLAERRDGGYIIGFLNFESALL